MVESGARPTIPFVQYEEIQRRVGRDPDERLQWALEFAQRDLGRLTPGDWDNLRWELHALATTVVWWDTLPKYHREKLRQAFGRHKLPGTITTSLPSREAVQRTQKRFLGILEQFKEKGYAETGEIPIGYFVQFHRSPLRRRDTASELATMFFPPLYIDMDPGYRRKPIQRIGGEFQNHALVKFAELLAGHPGLVRICPEEKCGRWFVASRLNREYCSKRCQMRAATRAYRKRQGQAAQKGRKKRRRVKRKTHRRRKEGRR
jgi:hypothetical protein